MCKHFLNLNKIYSYFIIIVVVIVVYFQAYPGVYQESLIDKSKTAEELSKLIFKNTLDTKNIVDTLQSNYDIEIENTEEIRNFIKQIAKNDNLNSKQITELEQSEGI